MKNKGFTLMELMIVIAIIMILAGAIVARVSTTGERAKIAKAKAECEEIASACRAFNLDTGLWPINLTDLIKPTPANGYDEKHGTPQLPEKSWGGPYLETESEEVPQDPWKGDYQFVTDGKKFYVKAGGDYAKDASILVHIFNEAL